MKKFFLLCLISTFTLSAHATPAPKFATVDVPALKNKSYSINMQDPMNCAGREDKLCGLMPGVYCGCDGEVNIKTTSKALNITYEGSCKALSMKQSSRKTTLRVTLIGSDCSGCRLTITGSEKTKTIVDLKRGENDYKASCYDGGYGQDTPGEADRQPGQ